MPEAVSLFDLPHAEARRLCGRGHVVYLGVNPVEFHGPHLSLHNDRLLSEGLSAALHQRIGGGAPFLVATDVEVGFEPTHGPGTRTVDFATTRQVIVAACEALAALGARRVVLMSFHGAPLHNLAIEHGCAALRRHGVRALAPFHSLLREMLMLDDAGRFGDALAPIRDATWRRTVHEGLKYDFHAGFFETSLALHFAPQSVSPAHRELAPCPTFAPTPIFARASRMARRLGRDVLARELDFVAAGSAWNALRPFPGYTGWPALASAESGAAFARHIVDHYVDIAGAVLERGERPPAPIMPWAETATAWGRMFRTPAPI